MARRYFVISDLHLADVEDHDDGWKAHKRSDRTFDVALDNAVDSFVAQSASGDELVLVLNGDIFDFDLVTRVPDDPSFDVRRHERVRGLDPTEARSAWKLRRILEDHSDFVSMLARFVALGHEIVHVAGNHDTELHFPEVRRVLVDAVCARALAFDLEPDPTKIRFERWFYYVPGEIYVEHGHQYDAYSSYADILDPVDRTLPQPAIDLSMGNLSNRTLLARMGTFNPHASDYILSLWRYAAHWLKHYAFTRRSALLVWFFGSLKLLWALGLRKRRRPGRKNRREALRLHAERAGLTFEVVEALDALRCEPVVTRFFRVLRELWFDRVLVALAMVLATVWLAGSSIPLWVQLMVPLSAFPLLWFVYNHLAEGDTIFDMEKLAPQRARLIARLLPVRVVTFGHSHVPEHRPVLPGVAYANTGTWAPIDAPGLRNSLTIVIDGHDVRVTLDTHAPRRRRVPGSPVVSSEACESRGRS